MKMSNLEKISNELDEARQKRAKLNLPQIDFEQYMAARTEDIASIKTASDFASQVNEFFNGDSTSNGISLPWSKVADQFHIRKGELTLWSGINGHGKSMVLGQVITHLMKVGQKCCIASFEMHPYKTLARMTRQVAGTNQPTTEYINQFMNWCDNKLWLYDQQGSVSSERVIAVIYYCAEQLGVQHFVVDSLMKCGIRSDDWNAQKEFVDKLCTVAKDTGVHIHLVAHSRKGESEYDLPSKFDISGSSDITNLADNVMSVWRNKKKEEGKAEEGAPDALVTCSKQRNGEDEPKIALWFDKASFRYLGSEGEKVWNMKL
jgi:twinkle protein